MEVLQSSVQVRNECSELMTEELVYFVVSGVRANVPIRVINAHGTNFVFSENKPVCFFSRRVHASPPSPPYQRRQEGGVLVITRARNTRSHIRAHTAAS